MEGFKSFEEILKPDSRSTSYMTINWESNEHRPIDLQHWHERITVVTLNEAVPEDIRSYFETVKNIFLYGWFVYPLYTIAMFLSYTCIEMALRKRFEPEDPRRRWKLVKLIHEARVRKLITNDGFASVLGHREYFRDAAMQVGEQPTEEDDFCTILEKTIPFFRNSMAHPEMDTIMMPTHAFPALLLTTMFINQLFSSSSNS